MKRDYRDYGKRLRRVDLGKISEICFKIAVINILIVLGSCVDARCLNVSSSRIEISVAPSKTYTAALTVRNTEKSTLRVKIRLEDWVKAVEGTGPAEAPKGSFGWLRIEPMEFELKEGEEKEISYEVSVPKEAKGELNAMIFVEARPKEIAEGSIGINTSIGVPIYAVVLGTEQAAAEIEDLKIINRDPLELGVKIKNSGNIHIRPTGEISVKTKDGKELFRVPLNEYNYPVLPDSSRVLEIKSGNRLEAGDYTADIQMGFEDKKCVKKTTLKIE